MTRQAAIFSLSTFERKASHLDEYAQGGGLSKVCAIDSSSTTAERLFVGLRWSIPDGHAITTSYIALRPVMVLITLRWQLRKPS